MKRFICLIVLLILTFCPFIATSQMQDNVYAANSDAQTKIQSYLYDFMQLGNLEAYEKVQDRRPGSEGEAYAADYLNALLLTDKFNNFEAVSDGSTTEGKQLFQFTSYITGLSAVSQNIRYIKKSAKCSTWVQS